MQGLGGLPFRRWANNVKADNAKMTGRLAVPRFAEVVDYSPELGAVRCKILPTGFYTGWISCGCPKAGNGVFVQAPPGIGEQVQVVPSSADNQNYVMVSSIPSGKSPPPVSPITNKPCQSGEVLVTTPQVTVHITTDGNVSIQTTGTLALQAGMITFKGPVTMQDELTVKNIAFSTHKHTGTQPGSGESGTPTAT